LIRKPEGAERASALRRTAETTLEAGQWTQQAARKTQRGCGSLVGWYLAIMFLFGALTASSWGARILGVIIVGVFIYIFRRIGRARRAAAG
jgi:hypothetical protein